MKLRRSLGAVLFLILVSAAPAAAQPLVQAVLNGNSFTEQLSDQVIAAIFGQNLTSGNAGCVPAAAPLPTDLCGAQVMVNGQLAPIGFASGGQINVHFPRGLGLGPGQVIVYTDGVPSNAFPITIQTHAPAFSRFLGGPSPIGLFFGADGQITEENPVFPGDTVAGFLVGLGATNPIVESGNAAPVNPLAVTVDTPDITVSGEDAEVLISALAPALVGFYQVNFVPSLTLGGGLHEVIAAIGGHTSPGVFLPVMSAAEAVEELTDIIDGSDIPEDTAASLTDKLDAAQESLEAPNADTRSDAANKLRAFINSVEAQSGKSLNEEEAEMLIEGANRILATL